MEHKMLEYQKIYSGEYELLLLEIPAKRVDLNIMIYKDTHDIFGDLLSNPKLEITYGKHEIKEIVTNYEKFHNFYALYFLSNEDINDGDYMYACEQIVQYRSINNFWKELKKDAKKVIAVIGEQLMKECNEKDAMDWWESLSYEECVCIQKDNGILERDEWVTSSEIIKFYHGKPISDSKKFIHELIAKDGSLFKKIIELEKRLN